MANEDLKVITKAKQLDLLTSKLRKILKVEGK